MKRIQEKVKDLIEVHSYKPLPDFYSEPAETVTTYYFTDATSDLMSKWIDRIVSLPAGAGAANALAGYRGVGKSHFLAAFGMLVANPELRSRITDSHVSASIQQLKRRHYPIASVRRGSHETLLEELQNAIAEAFAVSNDETNLSLSELLEFAAEKADDLTFILIIDTAFDRMSRVARDDGATLGEIAKLTEKLNIFVGVALDDDIAGADGANQAISSNYKIDFLDQEHLYKIVDTHIFPKHRQSLSLLRDIYAEFREVLPDFRWSEQRFTSLYPLHPSILELAPFVRLYVQNFALLGFVSEAGSKIMGRPANSLITLDEVFDSVEPALRKVEELKEAFEVFDRINSEIISELPIMERLQAKLILKSLLLLSLDGEGTSAGEICAAILIFDENDPPSAVKKVENLLEKFSESFAEDVQRIEVGEGRFKYSLKISGKDDLSQALAECVENLSTGVIPKLLRRVAKDRFADWTLAEEEQNENSDWTDSRVIWRGGIRRGKILWDIAGQNNPNAPDKNSLTDWEIIVTQKPEDFEIDKEIPQIFWKPAPMRKDEADTVLRYYALLTDGDLREKFSEQIRQAGHAHQLLVEKIWTRLFLDEAKIIYGKDEINFSENAKERTTLPELLNEVLTPVFEKIYPQHPDFFQTLEMAEVSALVNDFFSGARTNLENVQQMAEIYAQPLGLVYRHENAYLLETEENIVQLPLVRQILELVRANKDEIVSLKEIYQKLKQTPYGLIREAQHLLLTALVAQRQIEFVTSKGDRINRRSLDLKIIWDDIAGIAAPKTKVYGNKELADWARLLTESDLFENIETTNDREAAHDALRIWLETWNEANVLKRFDELPAEILNTRIWRTAANTEKTFGSAAHTVRLILENSINLEEGLHRIVDAFSDAETEFRERKKDLIVLEDFINGSKTRGEISNFLAVCENTGELEIENLREKLFELLDANYYDPNKLLNEKLVEIWKSFYDLYSKHFAFKHDLIMKSHYLQEKYDEILQSDKWWEFERLSKISVFPQIYQEKAKAVMRKFRELDCRFDVREILEQHPFCVCSFKLSKTAEWENLPETLQKIIGEGRENYRKILYKLSDTLIPLIENFTKEIDDDEFTFAAKYLIEILRTKESELLTDNQLIILRKVFDSISGSPLFKADPPADFDYLSREDLQLKFNKWLDELPNEPVLLKI